MAGYLPMGGNYFESTAEISQSMQVSGIQMNDPDLASGLTRRASFESLGTGTFSNESSEVEVEPILKYIRILNDAANIIAKSKVTAVAVNDRFILLGTQNGHVHQFDHAGYEVFPGNKRSFPVHPIAVNSISLDDSGEFYASCSSDGRVNIFGLFAPDFDVQECLPFKVEAICLDPRFALTRCFVTGGDKGLFWERGLLFGKYRRAELTRLQGSVSTIAWHSHYIAYALPNRVHIYDVQQHLNIEAIEKSDTYLRNDLYPCQLSWKVDDNVLIVGWGKTFSVYRIFELAITDHRNVPEKRLELHQSIKLDDFICGVAPFNDKVHKYFAIMCYPDVSEFDHMVASADSKVGDADGISNHEDEDKTPSFLLIEPTQIDDYEVINEELMKLANFKECLAADYKLASVYQENIYIVFNGHDLILGVPTNLVDHLEWLFQNDYLDTALEVAKNRRSELKEDLFRQFGFRYLDRLFEAGEFEKAAKNCKDILGKNPADWEKFIYEFIKKEQLKVLSLHIPTSEPQLKCEYYELILLIFLKKDPEQFLKLVNKWPGNIYSPQIVIDEVKDEVKKLRAADENSLKSDQLMISTSPESQKYRTLMQALAYLYQHTGQFSEALKIYLRGGSILGSPSIGANTGVNAGATNYVFDMIQKHKLFSKMTGEVEALMNFDKEKSLQMLIHHTEEMPVKSCVMQLEKSSNPKARRCLFDYLDRLYSKDSKLCVGYEDRLVELFAEFEPKKLMGFLKEDPEIDFPRAFEVCKRRNLTKEMIHIRKRTGDHSEALRLINESDSLTVEDAIAYCKDVDEQFLWDQLIESSKDNPKYITGLLNNIGTHVDPIKVIEKIRFDLEIHGLRDSLVKILQDYNLQRNLTEGCSSILVKDCFDLMNRMMNSQKRGHLISSTKSCLICHRALLLDQQSALTQFSTSVAATTPASTALSGSTGGITLFNCSHCFHSDCLAVQQQISRSSGGVKSPSSVPVVAKGTPSLARMSSNFAAVSESFFCPQCDPSR